MSFEQMAGDTNAAKELRRWNTPKRDGGMRPDGFEEFPKMLYKARRGPNGGPFIVIDPRDESWSEQNCLTVGNRHEEEKALEEGWRGPSPKEAIAYQNALEDAISMAAAERAQSDKRMSEKARAEAEAADAETAEHLPEIPVAPVRRRRS